MDWTAIFVALIGFAGACMPVLATVRKLTAKVDKLVEHDREQYLSILRLTVMSEQVPLSERLIAGKKYVDLGGNGDVKLYYENLVREHTK